MPLAQLLLIGSTLNSSIPQYDQKSQNLRIGQQNGPNAIQRRMGIRMPGAPTPEPDPFHQMGQAASLYQTLGLG